MNQPNAAILAIGSLVWDTDDARRRWRTTNVTMGRAIPARVPIMYGRRSVKRGKTFTMTFSTGPGWEALILPLKRGIDSFDDLVRCARGLWQAESGGHASGPICAPWGRVAIRFGRTNRARRLASEWSTFNRNQGCATIAGASDDGRLLAPIRAVRGRLPRFDVILAAATQPTDTAATVSEIGAAWCEQAEGYEHYLFQNIVHGIRTRIDSSLLRFIDQQAPAWSTTSSPFRLAARRLGVVLSKRARPKSK